MNSLKPCPFCSNEHPLTKTDSSGVEITCPQCQTIFRCDCTAGHNFDTDETIRRWNWRGKIELYSESNEKATQQTIVRLHDKWNKENGETLGD